MINEICSQLYDISNDNFKRAGDDNLPFLKISLLNALEQEDHIANIGALEGLEGMEYAESVYANCLYRPMDPESRRRIEAQMQTMAPDQFKRFVLNAVTGSQEFATRSMKLIDSNGNVISDSGSLKRKIFREFYFRYKQIAKHLPWLKQMGSKFNRAVTKHKTLK